MLHKKRVGERPRDNIEVWVDVAIGEIFIFNIYFLIGLALTIVNRCLLSSFFRLQIGKSAKVRKYKKEFSFIDRWFFISVHKTVKDKFSKAERRTIGYALISKTYFVVNIFNHALFVLFVAVLVLTAFFSALRVYLNICLIVFVCLHFLIVLLIGIMTYYQHAAYYRERDSRTWKRWCNWTSSSKDT